MGLRGKALTVKTITNDKFVWDSEADKVGIYAWNGHLVLEGEEGGREWKGRVGGRVMQKQPRETKIQTRTRTRTHVSNQHPNPHPRTHPRVGTHMRMHARHKST